jgi:hypothetical protein
MRSLNARSSPYPGGTVYDRIVRDYPTAARLAAILPILFFVHFLAFPQRAYGQQANGNSNRTIIADRDWDCSVGNRIPRGKPNEGVEEGISAAHDILERCSSCRKLFERVGIEPIDFLGRLKRIGAIIVTNVEPFNWTQDRPPRGPWRVVGVKRMRRPVEISAIHIPLQFDLRRPARPCIYVNPRGILAGRPEGYPQGAALTELRGLIILHELAHGARAIPSDDGDSKRGRDQSQENNKCMKRICVMCPDVFSPCLELPTRRSQRLKKRAAQHH